MTSDLFRLHCGQFSRHHNETSSSPAQVPPNTSFSCFNIDMETFYLDFVVIRKTPHERTWALKYV